MGIVHLKPFSWEFLYIKKRVATMTTLTICYVILECYYGKFRMFEVWGDTCEAFSINVCHEMYSVQCVVWSVQLQLQVQVQCIGNTDQCSVQCATSVSGGGKWRLGRPTEYEWIFWRSKNLCARILMLPTCIPLSKQFSQEVAELFNF